MTKLIPYEQYSFAVNIPSEKVLSLIKENTEPRRWFQWTGTKLFWGEVGEGTFSIYRQIRGRNSFLPLIKGKVLSQRDKTVIELKLHLHPAAIVFLVILFPVLIQELMIFLEVLFQNINTSGSMHLESFAPVGLVLFIYLLTTISFQFEVVKAKNEMYKIFAKYIQK